MQASQARQEQLVSTALERLESTLSQLQISDKTRQSDVKRVTQDIEVMRLDVIPHLLEEHDQKFQQNLTFIESELKTLRSLIAARNPLPSAPAPFIASSNGKFANNVKPEMTTDNAAKSTYDASNIMSDAAKTMSDTTKSILGIPLSNTDTGVPQIPEWQQKFFKSGQSLSDSDRIRNSQGSDS